MYCFFKIVYSPNGDLDNFVDAKLKLKIYSIFWWNLLKTNQQL